MAAELRGSLWLVIPSPSLWTHTLTCRPCLPTSEPMITHTYRQAVHSTGPSAGSEISLAAQSLSGGGGSLESPCAPYAVSAFSEPVCNPPSLITALVPSITLCCPFWDLNSFNGSPDTLSEFGQPHPRACNLTCWKTDTPSAALHSY